MDNDISREKKFDQIIKRKVTNVDQSITSIHRRYAEPGTPETDITGKSSITLGGFPERHPNDTIKNKLDGTNIGNVQRLQKVRQNLRRTRRAVNARRKVQGA